MGRDRESDNYIDDDLGYTYTYLTKVSDVIESFRLKTSLMNGWIATYLPIYVAARVAPKHVWSSSWSFTYTCFCLRRTIDSLFTRWTIFLN